MDCPYCHRCWETETECKCDDFVSCEDALDQEELEDEGILNQDEPLVS